MRTVLGIDLGTQSLKVVFYDPESSSVVAVASSALDLDQDADGKAEQDPAWWLEALAAAAVDIGNNGVDPSYGKGLVAADFRPGRTE